MELTSAVQRKTLFCKCGQKATQGFVDRREYRTGERATKALKTGALFFTGMILAVFIPVLHFILVPGLFVALVAFTAAAWMEKAEVVAGEFTCPECERLNTLPRESETFPRTVRCSHCHFTLRLDLKP